MIPRLAWCAHLRRGENIVRVYHGPWVETRDDWFVDGAWMGPFERGEIDGALFNVGCGGVLRGERAVFCSPTDVIERLYSIRVADDLFLSNTLSFLLAMAGDEPDPCYPFYGTKLREYRDAGIQITNKKLCTRRGRHIRLHEYCQVAAGNDLQLIRLEKPAFAEPKTFADYVTMLQNVLQRVLENAASPKRFRRYEGVATVSGGFDSNAVAVLLARLGVREAITFYNGIPGVDSGEEIARRLGMTAHVYGRTDFRTAPGINEAEFLAWPDKTSDIVFAPCEPLLERKILATGRYGDAVFGSKKFALLGSDGIGGSRMIEFRLRVGFMNFNPLFAGGLHLTAMRRIAASEEMKPWRLGGNYDRPVARRILEEAGIPRGSFGTSKHLSANYRFKSVADLSPATRTAFESYRQSMPKPGLLHHSLHLAAIKLRLGCRHLAQGIQSIWWTGGVAAQSMIPVPSRFRPYNDLDFAMHWGQSRIRERYAEAVQIKMSLPGCH